MDILKRPLFHYYDDIHEGSIGAILREAWMTPDDSLKKK